MFFVFVFVLLLVLFCFCLFVCLVFFEPVTTCWYDNMIILLNNVVTVLHQRIVTQLQKRNDQLMDELSIEINEKKKTREPMLNSEKE